MKIYNTGTHNMNVINEKYKQPLIFYSKSMINKQIVETSVFLRRN